MNLPTESKLIMNEMRDSDMRGNIMSIEIGRAHV